MIYASFWCQGVDRLSDIRQRRYDVIVDLSGWTVEILAVLHARLAPVRVIVECCLVRSFFYGLLAW